MGGRSGSRTAAHTLLVTHGGLAFALTVAEMRIVWRALATEHRWTVLEPGEILRARKLVSLGLGELIEDDEAFRLKEGVRAR